MTALLLAWCRRSSRCSPAPSQGLGSAVQGCTRQGLLFPALLAGRSALSRALPFDHLPREECCHAALSKGKQGR